MHLAKISLILLCLLCSASLTFADGLTISDAKLLPDTSLVRLSAKVVTYAETDFFYIEEDSRCIGIRVGKPAHGLAVGMRADVEGEMSTNPNRERVVVATTAAQTPAPNSNGLIAPVGMNNSALGGSDWHVFETGGQREATGTFGLNNIGLLVTTWGQFQQIDATAFTVDDGSDLYVKCTVPAGTFLYSGWQYVGVTGISSLYKFNNSIYPPNLLVRDIQVTLPEEVVSVPGIPTGNMSPLVNVSNTYSTSGSTCSQGHAVEYSFDWGDGTSSPWSTSTSASHSWSALGQKTFTVTARCQVHTTVAVTSAGLGVNVIACPYTGEMIYIPAGSFGMGGSSVPEWPQHMVLLSDYYIGKREVTRGEYRQFMDAGGYLPGPGNTKNPCWSDEGWSWKVSNNRTQPSAWVDEQYWDYLPGWFTQTDNHPVAGVSYYEAEAFCNWAGGHLPTEAQWERAARGDIHANVYPWGDTWDKDKCKNRDDSLYPGRQTAPVGSYPSGDSPCGCQDMAGNVLEWCKDWYGAYYYQRTPTGGWSDPQGPTSGDGGFRVRRGGDWSSEDDKCRCAYRGCGPPDSGEKNLGFRFAR